MADVAYKENVDYHRLNRIDDAIDKLTSVSSDLSKILAVQEVRLSNTEKAQDNIASEIEKKHASFDKSIQEVYKNMHEHDGKIIEELKVITKDITETIGNVEKKIHGLTERMHKFEKIFYMGLGGAAVIGSVITYILHNYHYVITPLH